MMAVMVHPGSMYPVSQDAKASFGNFNPVQAHHPPSSTVQSFSNFNPGINPPPIIYDHSNMVAVTNSASNWGTDNQGFSQGLTDVAGGHYQQPQEQFLHSSYSGQNQTFGNKVSAIVFKGTTYYNYSNPQGMQQYHNQSVEPYGATNFSSMPQATAYHHENPGPWCDGVNLDYSTNPNLNYAAYDSNTVPEGRYIPASYLATSGIYAANGQMVQPFLPQGYIPDGLMSS